MKSVASWLLLLWLGIVLERTRPELFPSAVLVVPLAVGCLFWLRNGTGMLISGASLTLAWLLNPDPFPVTSIVTLLLDAFFLTSEKADRRWSGRKRREWLAPAFTVIAALLSHAVVLHLSAPTAVVSAFASRLVVAMPLTTAVVIMLHLAGEFGPRRHSLI